MLNFHYKVTPGLRASSLLLTADFSGVSLKISCKSNEKLGNKKYAKSQYLKLEFLKLHFVCFCFAADFQANPTADISSKKSGKIQTTSLR